MHDKLNMINNVQINRKIESKCQIINKGVHSEERAISSMLANKLFSELKGAFQLIQNNIPKSSYTTILLHTTFHTIFDSILLRGLFISTIHVFGNCTIWWCSG